MYLPIHRLSLPKNKQYIFNSKSMLELFHLNFLIFNEYIRTFSKIFKTRKTVKNKKSNENIATSKHHLCDGQKLQFLLEEPNEINPTGANYFKTRNQENISPILLWFLILPNFYFLLQLLVPLFSNASTFSLDLQNPPYFFSSNLDLTIFFRYQKLCNMCSANISNVSFHLLHLGKETN